jgi:hypothetical protein
VPRRGATASGPARSGRPRSSRSGAQAEAGDLGRARGVGRAGCGDAGSAAPAGSREVPTFPGVSSRRNGWALFRKFARRSVLPARGPIAVPSWRGETTPRARCHAVRSEGRRSALSRRRAAERAETIGWWAVASGSASFGWGPCPGRSSPVTRRARASEAGRPGFVKARPSTVRGGPSGFGGRVLAPPSSRRGLGSAAAPGSGCRCPGKAWAGAVEPRGRRLGGSRAGHGNRAGRRPVADRQRS